MLREIEIMVIIVKLTSRKQEKLMNLLFRVS